MSPTRLAILATIALATPLPAQSRRPSPTPAAVAPPTPAPPVQLLGGLSLGYNAGAGGSAMLTGVNLFKGSPLQARVGLTYNSGAGGDAQAARHAFINDATNGTPQDKAHTWGFRLDMLHPVGLLPGHNTQAFVGIRHSWFTGNYRLVGANEDFDVTSSNWGLGGGLETLYPLSSTLNFTITAGMDYFFGSRLYGHDTAYTPSGSNQENPRDGFSYSDADAAVAQPKFTPVLLAGLQFKL